MTTEISANGPQGVPDRSRLETRGICIFGVRAGRISWGRLYMEDVERGEGIGAAVESLAGAVEKSRVSES